MIVFPSSNSRFHMHPSAIADKEEPLEYQIVGEILEENEEFITLIINKCISEDDLEENRMNIRFIIPKGCIKERYDFQEVKDDRRRKKISK